MMKFLVIAAALALGACNQQHPAESSNVMNEIEKAEKQAASHVEETQTLPSGLQIQFRARGPDQTLPHPSAQATVLVHYEGSLVSDGTVFDSSFQRNEPASFPLQAVVPGFSEAIEQMRPGDELVATMPPALGYGAPGRGPIPPNAALRFRIRLIAFQEPDGRTVGHP
jgi:FKBP-type peptidyl-prolyl cis-trans isomerase